MSGKRQGKGSGPNQAIDNPENRDELAEFMMEPIDRNHIIVLNLAISPELVEDVNELICNRVSVLMAFGHVDPIYASAFKLIAIMSTYAQVLEAIIYAHVSEPGEASKLRLPAAIVHQEPV